MVAVFGSVSFALMMGTAFLAPTLGVGTVPKNVLRFDLQFEPGRVYCAVISVSQGTNGRLILAYDENDTTYAEVGRVTEDSVVTTGSRFTVIGDRPVLLEGKCLVSQ